jgi:hypothetical protein
MEHYSILDQAPPASETEAASKKERKKPNTESPSAGIAAIQASCAKIEPTPRFPGEDAGRSLAEMAHADLDAALQLLADRAQYITGASGAAIALRRETHDDMICRASVGPNAPELGALLSMEYGLSGESVRTRTLLRCDDAERDPRVNHEICRKLGIASVIVMPLVQEQQVLGVLELLSGKPKAFNDHDLSALTRLGEMVLTAVNHSSAGLRSPAVLEYAFPKQAPVDHVEPEEPQPEFVAELNVRVPAPVRVEPSPPGQDQKQDQKVEIQPTKQAEPIEAPIKPLFWSAALKAQAGESHDPSHDPTIKNTIPAVLRSLRKCQACGFPVSQDRTLCVECEEKQWHGQRLPQPKPEQAPADAPIMPPRQAAVVHDASTAPVQLEGRKQEKVLAMAAVAGASGAALSASQPAVASAVAEVATVKNFSPTPSTRPPNAPIIAPVIAETAVAEVIALAKITSDATAAESPDFETPFLGSALPDQSWFAANRYILFALLLVAVIVAAVAWLH